MLARDALGISYSLLYASIEGLSFGIGVEAYIIIDTISSGAVFVRRRYTNSSLIVTN